MDQRLTHLEGRVNQHASPFTRFEKRFDGLEQRMARLEERVDARFDGIDRRFDLLDTKLSHHFAWMMGIHVTVIVAFVGITLVTLLAPQG